MDSADYWVRGDNDEVLDNISKESLTKLLASIDSLKHASRDTMLSWLDHATQW